MKKLVLFFFEWLKIEREEALDWDVDDEIDNGIDEFLAGEYDVVIDRNPKPAFLIIKRVLTISSLILTI